MTSDLALKPHWRSAIDNLLRAHVPHCDVWAYGSRVTGENHEASDLDLVLRAPSLEPVGPALSALRAALSESNVPIVVEVRDWARLPQSFHDEIERQYVGLRRRDEQRVSRR